MTFRGLVRICLRLLTMTGRESSITTKSEDAPKSKPHLSPDAAVLAYSGELEGRERQLKMQQEAMDAGRLSIGMWSARETQQVLQE